MDILAISLAKKAKGSADAVSGRVTTLEGETEALDGRVTVNEGDIDELENQVGALSSGMSFKGSVDYVDDLPSSGNTTGDVYAVKYAGSSGTTALGEYFVWGDDGGTDSWILLYGTLTNAEIQSIWEDN